MEMVRLVISSQNAAVVNDRVRCGQELRQMPQAPRSSSVQSFRMVIFNSPRAALTTELNHAPGVNASATSAAPARPVRGRPSSEYVNFRFGQHALASMFKAKSAIHQHNPYRLIDRVGRTERK